MVPSTTRWGGWCNRSHTMPLRKLATTRLATTDRLQLSIQSANTRPAEIDNNYSTAKKNYRRNETHFSQCAVIT